MANEALLFIFVTKHMVMTSKLRKTSTVNFRLEQKSRPIYLKRLLNVRLNRPILFDRINEEEYLEEYIKMVYMVI